MGVVDERERIPECIVKEHKAQLGAISRPSASEHGATMCHANLRPALHRAIRLLRQRGSLDEVGFCRFALVL